MGQVLVVTGGGRGIGAATARLAGRRAYAVCVNYRRDRDSALRVVEDIERAGARALAVAADVSVEADVVRLFATVDAELGTLTSVTGLVRIIRSPQGMTNSVPSPMAPVPPTFLLSLPGVA
ncbi:MAG TPA: SDR family NAD(P)-dependent oxidoreductase [Thermoanaerobaculia bacterium]|nr:SDR family NAD(P)-dependent oxidoreductase [Thermoanaerobaculia bacterium]